MSVYLTADIAKINIQHELNKNTNSYQKTIERLSSGTKFTKTADAPMASSQATKMEVKISATKKSTSNVYLGQDLLTTASANQEKTIETLQSIKDLCLQAANGTYSSSDKNAILEEIRSNLASIDLSASSTDFNGAKLLNGSCSNLKLQIGPNSTNTMEVGDALINVHCSQLGGDIRIPAATTGETWTAADVSNYTDKINLALTTVIGTNCTLGGYQNRLSNTLVNLETSSTNLSQGKSVISDADIAAESADLVKYQILQQSAASVLTQANQSSSFVLSLLNIN